MDGVVDVAVAAMVVVGGLVELPPRNGLDLLVRALAELPAAAPPVLGAVELVSGFRFWFWFSRSKKAIRKADEYKAVRDAPNENRQPGKLITFRLEG